LMTSGRTSGHDSFQPAESRAFLTDEIAQRRKASFLRYLLTSLSFT